VRPDPATAPEPGATDPHERDHRRPQRDHHRLGALRLHRSGVRRPRGTRAAGLRGVGDRRGCADEHHRGGELPRLPRRHHGPGADGRDARPGGAVRRRARHRRRRGGRPDGRPQGREDRDRHLHRARRDPGDRVRLPQARPAARGGALRPRRLLVRDLRRLLLPRAGDRRRRRRRLRHRGGDVPHPLRVAGLPRPPARRAACLQDHAGARVRRPQARDGLELRDRRDQRRRPAGVRHPPRHRDRRGARPRRDGAVHRHRPRPAVGAADGAGGPRRRRLRPGRPPLDRDEPPRCVRRRRPRGPPLPPGDHRRRHGLRRRSRRRALHRRARPRGLDGRRGRRRRGGDQRAGADRRRL
ncbi:MAG: Thioredoxin reductase, partial [uncultured Nocardioides sp.]